jgi:hypothetical protein
MIEIVDQENTKREEEDKEEKGEVVSATDCFRFNTKEQNLSLSTHFNFLREVLYRHAGCALVKF